jgi:hypothetical protein
MIVLNEEPFEQYSPIEPRRQHAKRAPPRLESPASNSPTLLESGMSP